MESADDKSLFNRFKEIVNEVASYTDLNDIAVGVTTVTREGLGWYPEKGNTAINIDGTTATSTDKAFTVAGALLPMVSGSAIKKVLGVVDNAKDLKTTEKAVKKYDVGNFNDLQKRSVVGDGLDLHHVPQKKPAGQVIDGYNPKKAPAIAIPSGVHKKIPTTKGNYSGTARDQLAKDAKDLRNVGVPNNKIKEIIDYNKNKYPNAYKKK